jgi:adenosylcobinamide-GDP ribazoletransferase
VAIADELRAAVGGATCLRRLVAGVPREARAGGLVFYPLIGALAGLLAAAALRLAEPAGGPIACVAALVVLAATWGGRTVAGAASAAGALGTSGGNAAVLTRLRGRPSPGGLVIAAACWLVKLWALLRIPEAARPLALVLAAMLGRWAIIVQCYGGVPSTARGLAADLVGRARLREFGWASSVTFAVTLALLDAIGLVVLLAVTLATVGFRILAYRRAGGLTGRLLMATAELIETIGLLVLGALARG